MQGDEKTPSQFRKPPAAHWYAAVWSHELKKERSIRTYLFDQAIVLFRQADGKVAALRDQCPHRLVPLSAGSCEGSSIRCPYHGWKFDSTGTLVEMPGLPREEACPALRVATFPSCEQDGIIWVYPVANAQPTTRPYKIPGVGENGFNSFTMEAEIEGEMIFALENFLDATHTHYVHAGLIRHDRQRKRVRVEMHRQENEISATYHGEELSRGLISRLLTCGNREIVGIGRLLNPTIAQLEYTTDKNWKMYITVPYSPTRGLKIRTKIIVSYRPALPSWIAKSLIYPLFAWALKQDLAIFRLQGQNAGSAAKGSPSVQVTPLDLMFPHILDMWRERERSGEPLNKKYTVWMDL